MNSLGATGKSSGDSDADIPDLQDMNHLSSKLQRAFEDLKSQLTVDTAKLKEITEQFEIELRDGLEKEGANIGMNATWIMDFPSGRETGSYLTIDLGGTNLRVCWITLKGSKGQTHIEQDIYILPDEIKTGSIDRLWSLIVNSLSDFIQKHSLKGDEDHPLPLGFTFSYPVVQQSIDSGKLVTWTKGFDIKGMEGEDVAAQLRDAMAKRKLPVRLVALINDTAGALIASAYVDPDTIIGAIFGTGCNAAYFENVGSIPKLNYRTSTSLPPDTPMAINCEYGAFDNAHRVLPLTKYDEIVDRDSPRPGEQAFEKMSAGLYLGEIFRLVMCDLHDKGLVFRGAKVDKLREPYILDTGFLSSLENDSLDIAAKQYKDLLDMLLTEEELYLSRLLAEIIATRGARLCTCGVAAICQKTGISKGHVAADGSVANKHPRFKKRWAEAFREIFDWEAGGEGREHKGENEDAVCITSAEDGSGIGAAVIAAMTLERIRKEETERISRAVV